MNSPDALLHLALGAPPASTGNHAELLRDGEAAYAAVMDAIQSATRSIHLSTLILAGDEIGAAVCELLEKKAKAGVEVRVLVDALFRFRSDRRQLARLRAAGGRLAWFMPMWHVPFRGKANLRLHRKTVLCDDRLAIVGGMNIAREYMGPTPLAGRWRDLSVRLTGPAVEDIAAVFRADWAFASGQALIDAAPTTEVVVRQPGAGASIQVVGSGPDVESDLIYDALLSGVFEARRRLWSATPYFVPDEALAGAIVLAARRGVDVPHLIKSAD